MDGEGICNGGLRFYLSPGCSLLLYVLGWMSPCYFLFVFPYYYHDREGNLRFAYNHFTEEVFFCSFVPARVHVSPSEQAWFSTLFFLTLHLFL